MKNFRMKSIFTKKGCLKICSGIIAVSMLFGIVGTVSATEIIANNFEQNFNVDSGEKNGNIFFDASRNDAERIILEDGNGVLKIPTLAELDGAGAVGLKDALENKNYILSFDFYAKQTDTKFMIQARDTKSKAYIMFVVGANGKVGFAINAGWNDHDPDSSFYSTEYNANEWNSVDVVVDTSTQVLEYFINGVSIGSKRPDGNSETAILSYMSLFSGLGKDPSSELYLDNIRINYVEDNDFRAFASTDGKTIKAEFTQTPEMSDENKVLLTDVKIYDAVTGDKVSVNSVKTDGRNLVIDAGIKADRQYTLVFADGIKSIARKTISDRFVTVFSGEEPEAYVRAAIMRDLAGIEYNIFDDIPVTQDYIKLMTTGEAVDLASVNTVSLKDEDGNVCALGVPSAIEGGIKIPVTEFLNPGKEYILKASGLTAGNVQLPVYTAKFKTTTQATDGFAEADIVLNDGNSVENIEVGSQVFVSTKYVNVTNAGGDATFVIGAYAIEENGLNLLEMDVKTVDMTASKFTVIGPGNTEISIKVPDGTDIIKAFIFDAEKANAPVCDAVVRPEYTQDAVSGKIGATQTGKGEVTVVGEGFESGADVSVRVILKGSAFDSSSIYVDQAVADENGKAGICFLMNDNISDTYTVLLTDANGNKKEYDIAYVNDDEYSVVADNLNKAVAENADDTAVEDIIKADYRKLGISTILFEKIETKQAAKLLFNELKDNEIDKDNREKGTELAQKIFIISAVANGMVENLFEYEEELGLTDDKNYEWYSKEYVSESVEEVLTSRQVGSYKTTEEFFDAMEDSFILSVVQYPDGVANLREVLQDDYFAKKIGIPTTAKESTYLGLSGKNFDDLSELKEKFKTLEATTSKPSGSSGGGRGSGSTSASKAFTGEYPLESKPETILFELFDDLDGFEWAKQSIIYLAERNIITGKEEGKFCPEDMITREEMAALLVRAFVKDVEDKNITFSDAVAGSWYDDYLKKAASAEIIQGYEDGRFGVGEYITRQDMVVMFTRTMDFAGIVIESENDGNLFADDAQIADYAKDSVYKLKQAGIVNGVTVDTFAPNDNANRAQAAKIIFSLLNI